MRIFCQAVFAVFLFFLGSSVVAAQERTTIFVSILPQKFFVQQISGDFFNVEVMVKPGASPATYEPKPSQMRKLSKAAIYFSIGVPFENVWLQKIADVNPSMEIVHTDKDIQKLAMVAHHHEEEEHDHDEHPDEETSGLDPHIWLAPSLVKKQVSIIGETLIRVYPEQGKYFRSNLVKLNRQIDELHEELQKALLPWKDSQFMVFHPSWGYWAHEYGLKQVAVEVEGKNPKSAQLLELIEHARKEKIRVVFAQPQFSTKSAQVIAHEIDGRVITIDPLAENWFENMRHVAQTFISTVR